MFKLSQTKWVLIGFFTMLYLDKCIISLEKNPLLLIFFEEKIKEQLRPIGNPQKYDTLYRIRNQNKTW